MSGNERHNHQGGMAALGNSSESGRAKWAAPDTSYPPRAPTSTELGVAKEAEKQGSDEASAERPGGEAEAKPRSILREIGNWLRDLVVAALLCVFLILYVAQPFRIEKTSMMPLLADGDRIIVSKISLLLETIRRGDIVVLHNPTNPDESWIKRIIGLPGEEVRMVGGVIYINGEPLEEGYIGEEARTGGKDTYPSEELAEFALRHPYEMSEFGLAVRPDPGGGEENVVVQIVPQGHYFVLGDNRQHSMDSRDSMFSNPAVATPDSPNGPGLIPKLNIYGKAIFRYWPLNKIGPIPAAVYPGSSRR